MTIKELLTLAHDIRSELDIERANRKLSFVEKTHKYSIYDPINERITSNLPSVSSLLKEYYEPFDSLTKSLQMMDGDEDKAAELRMEWQKKGNDATSIGSYTHYKLEQYVWNLFDISKDVRKPYYTLGNSELLEAQGMLKTGVDLIHTIINNGFVPLDTEVVMGSIDLGYFGQCDNIWLGEYKGRIVFLMTDYKTNQTKNFQEAPYNLPMRHPFQELLDTDLSKYYIQQPLYAQLFKDMLKNTIYKDIPFIGFRILHLRDGGNSIKIPNWVYNEIKKLYPVNE